MDAKNNESEKWNNIINFFFDEHYKSNNQIYYSIPEIEPMVDEQIIKFPDIWESDRGYDYKFWDFWDNLKNSLPPEYTVDERCLIRYTMPMTQGDTISALYLFRINKRYIIYQEVATLEPSIFKYNLSDGEAMVFSTDFILEHLFEDDLAWMNPFSLVVDKDLIKIKDVAEFIVQKDEYDRFNEMDTWGNVIILLQCSDPEKLKQRLTLEELEFLNNIDEDKLSSKKELKSKLKDIYRICLPE